MNYSIQPGHVRGELFDRRADGAQGKWEYTVVLDMSKHYDSLYAVRDAWLAGDFTGTTHAHLTPAERQAKMSDPDGYWLVVLDPYQHHQYPVMMAV